MAEQVRQTPGKYLTNKINDNFQMLALTCYSYKTVATVSYSNFCSDKCIDKNVLELHYIYDASSTTE